MVNPLPTERDQSYYDRWHEMLRGPLPDGVAILEALHSANMPLFGTVTACPNCARSWIS